MSGDAHIDRGVEARLRTARPPRTGAALEALVLAAAREAWREPEREAPAGLVWLWPAAAAAALLLVSAAQTQSDRVLARWTPDGGGTAAPPATDAAWAADDVGAPWRALAASAAARRPRAWRSFDGIESL